MQCIAFSDGIIGECYLQLHYDEDSPLAEKLHDIVYEGDEYKRFLGWVQKNRPDVCTQQKRRDETHWHSSYQFDNPIWTRLAREYIEDAQT